MSEQIRQHANRITTISERVVFERQQRENQEHWVWDYLPPLREAIRAKAKTVVLKDDKKYTIEYGHEFVSKVTGHVTHCVLLKPADGYFAPMGYFDIAKIGA